MKETAKCRYQKSFQDTYLIISDCDRELTESYFGKISLKEHIRGLLPCELRLMDGALEAWYPISSLQAIAQAFCVKELHAEELKDIVLQTIQIVKELDRFLLDGRQLCFLPEYVFWQMDTGQIFFLFDYTERKEESDLSSLASFILERTCHEDEKAVELAYFFYECCSKDNFSIKEVENFVEQWPPMDNCIETEQKENEITREGCPKKETETQTMSDQRVPEENFRKNQRLLTGIGIVLFSLLLFAGFWPAQWLFVFSQKEKIIWFAVSALLFVSGMEMGLSEIRSYAVREKNRGMKKEQDKVDNMPLLSAKNMTEADCFRTVPDACQEAAPGRDSAEDYRKDSQLREQEKNDGRTIYIGSQVRDRTYELLYRKKGKEETYEISCFPFLLGKEQGSVNLTIRDMSVSRIHARFLQEEGVLYLEDMHSTNGTFVNDLPLQPHERFAVKRGDILQFGRAEFILQ
ncbi:MAG: DUF6382 domain-containing protein [Lachnospiraceae bacterium]